MCNAGLTTSFKKWTFLRLIQNKTSKIHSKVNRLQKLRISKTTQTLKAIHPQQITSIMKDRHCKVDTILNSIGISR